MCSGCFLHLLFVEPFEPPVVHGICVSSISDVILVLVESTLLQFLLEIECLQLRCMLLQAPSPHFFVDLPLAISSFLVRVVRVVTRGLINYIDVASTPAKKVLAY